MRSKTLLEVLAPRTVTGPDGDNPITNEQIRELLLVAEAQCRVPRTRYISIEAPACVGDLIAANWALGNFEDWYLDDTGFFHRVGGKHADRAKCIVNANARLVALWNARHAQNGGAS